MPKLLTTRTRIADLGTPRIIIIGGGFAGLEVAKAFRGAKVQVVLFDKYNHFAFQPLLYQVATSGLETSSIVAPFRRLFRSQKDFYFRLAEVIQIKADQNYIETSIGGVAYDYLVIATGAVTNFYGMQGLEKYASCLKTIVDATKLRNKIIRHLEYALLTEDEETMNSFMDFVIVGGGPTGVELAGALSELKKNSFPKDYKELDMRDMDIHLIESSPRLLNGMSPQASAKAEQFLTEMGVNVRLGTAVKSYDGYEVVLANGEKIISRSVIWTAGVRANPVPGLAADLIGRGNRIRVDEFNRVKSFSNIFAIGDVALMEGTDPHFPHGHPQMAPPAQQQGRLVAKNIRNLISGKPLKPFHYFNKGAMATIGRNRAVVDMRGGIRFQGVFAWYVWMFVHLMSLVGFRNKVFTFISWMWNYFSFDRSNRLIIGRNEERLSPDEVRTENMQVPV